MAAPARNTKLKCYIHEMRSPLEPPFDPRKYQVCAICQARLLEMAKANTRLVLAGQIVTLSTAEKEVKDTTEKKPSKEMVT